MDVRKRVEAAVRGSELPYLIARPGFVTGSDREEWRAGERFAATVSDGALRLLGKLGAKRLATRYLSMTGAELAAAMVELACTSTEAQLVAEVEQLKAASSPAPSRDDA
jgi:alkanesulfonate monooxygenase SsuD/methylene tetrahydromethanopterin reductase-like flavin-dependent oxidoreductase (luciferase family)